MSFLDKHRAQAQASDVLPGGPHDFDAAPVVVLDARTVRVSLDVYEKLPKGSGVFKRTPEITGQGADGVVRVVCGGHLTWALCKLGDVPRKIIEDPDGEVTAPGGVIVEWEAAWCRQVAAALHAGEDGALVVEFTGLGEKRVGMNEARLFEIVFLPDVDWREIAADAAKVNAKAAKAAQKGD